VPAIAYFTHRGSGFPDQNFISTLKARFSIFSPLHYWFFSINPTIFKVPFKFRSFFQGYCRRLLTYFLFLFEVARFSSPNRLSNS
jgi:hypothetical protein